MERLHLDTVLLRTPERKERANLENNPEVINIKNKIVT